MAFYGIDLGTTFSSVAYAERGAVRVVPLELGGPTLASVALLDGRDVAAPRVVVGRLAAERYRALCEAGEAPSPAVTLIRGSKNHLAVAGPVASGPPWALGDASLRATDVAALLLRALADAVARTPGLPPLDGAVVTHPQRFRNRERRATAQAVFLAGLRGVGMLPEPDAAAWAYGVAASGGGRAEATFMVFDFGGGTLDVTVMRRAGGERPRLDALASYGVQLGGAGVDEALRERLLARYAEAAGRPGLTADALDEASRELLLAAAEGVKIQLNAHATADVNPAARTASRTFALATAEGDGLPTATVRVTLADLAAWIADTVERAVDCAVEALHLASLTWNDLDELLLVGGSSWLYPVQSRLRAYMSDRVRLHDDLDHPLNPRVAVAAGAALFAEELWRGDDRAAAALDYHGVTPDAFGVRAREPDPQRPGERRETLAVLVPALTRVPFEGRRTFRKRGGARVLPVDVLEGRSLAEATPLGRFLVELDAALPDGAPVDVTLRIGRDGVLSLEVRDPATGLARATTLADAEGLYADDELEARRAFLTALPLERG
ncbi:MAG: Hsp70 family protein [Polyangiales bacterium]